MTPIKKSNPLLRHVALLGAGLLLLSAPLAAALEVTTGKGGVQQGLAKEAGGGNGDLALENDSDAKHGHRGEGENGENVLKSSDALVAASNKGLPFDSSEQAEISKKSYLRVSDSSEMVTENAVDSNCRWTGCERGGCASGEVEKDSVSCGLFYNNEYCCKPTPPPTPSPTPLPTPPPTPVPTAQPTDKPTPPRCRWTDCEIGGCESDEIEEDWESCGLFHPNREYCCKINTTPLAIN